MRALLVLGTLAAILALAPVSAIAAQPPDADTISQYTAATRMAFMNALAAARRGDLAEKSGELAELRGYPLYPYLTAAQLNYELNTEPGSDLDAQIADFISAHPSLPPTHRLKNAWLDNLAARGQWQTIVNQTQGESGTTATCRRVAAQIHLGTVDLSEAQALYDVATSQPSACDPIFTWLANTGNLTPALLRDRAHKAILANNLSLARYLAQQLPDSDTPTLNSWIAVINDPASLVEAPTSLDDDVVVHAFKRYALSDPQAAANALPEIVARFSLSASDQNQMRRYIALLFAEDHRPEALLWFARVDHAPLAAKSDDHALGWEVRSAIYARRWPLVLDYIDSLPASIAKDEEWRYWKARALAETGNKAAARAIYTELAENRSYHGYLAADALNEQYHFNAHPVPNDPSALAALDANPVFARARELYALGMNGDAYLEWRQLVSALPRDQLMQAAKLASQWHWYARAIITLAHADYWDDLDIRYPTPFSATVDQDASTNGLDPAYVYAIMRTESLFQPTAHSPVGALGLMQLMPGTAAHIASRLGSAAPSDLALDEPAVNIRYGSRYLADMLHDWSGNIALATASYNAGPRKIAQWLPSATMPADIWIATIPYTETRKYVEQVMSHMTVFQHRLAEPVVPLDKRLDPVQPTYTQDDGTSF